MMRPIFIPVPDNGSAFFAYVNLVINNRENTAVVEHPTDRPTRIGNAQIRYTRNEVGESWMEVLPGKTAEITRARANFIKRTIDQFCLLRTYWKQIAEEVEYEYADKY